MDLHPLTLNDAIARTVPVWRTFRRQLKTEGLSELDPFLFTRFAAGRTAFLEVQALPDAEPLKVALLAWIHRLLEQRVNGPLLARIAEQYQQELHPCQLSASGHASLRSQWGEVLRDGARRREWFDAYCASSGELSRSISLLWERRSEIARRLGLASPRTLNYAGEPSAVVALAEDWLERTAPLAKAVAATDLAQRFDQALGLVGALRGWPRHLGPRSLLELAGMPELVRGFELDPGPLPLLIGPASFLRALARLGAAWVDAAAAKHVPFVIRHDPYGLKRAIFGAVFGTLPWQSAFMLRNQELGRQHVDEQQRALGRVLLLESRHAALRTLLADRALAGPTSLAETYSERLERELELKLPPSVVAAYLRPRLDSSQRFLGLLLGRERMQRLIQTHDQDWFRNPRAIEELRAEGESLPSAKAEPDEVRRAATAFECELVDRLA